MQACIPAQPDPPPLATFRGEPLTHETAEALFIGCVRHTGISVLLDTAQPWLLCVSTASQGCTCPSIVRP